jgi:23S rRNA (uracil1939-C5)-methyltransferase
VNTAVNKKMVEHVVSLALQVATQNATVYDLYCGSGNFTFPLANELATKKMNVTTVGIEENASAIRQAEEQYKSIAPPYKMQFFSKDVGLFLTQLAAVDKTAVFVLDPPRAGLSKVVLDHCLRLNPGALIYISCNLSTLARDLEHLKARYHAVALTSFDMFPQTEYIETVSLLLPRDTP